MFNVIIEAEGLPFSIKLKRRLEDRQAIVVFTKDKDRALEEKVDAKKSLKPALFAQKYFDSINGQSGLIDIAKSYKRTIYSSY